MELSTLSGYLLSYDPSKAPLIWSVSEVAVPPYSGNALCIFRCRQNVETGWYLLSVHYSASGAYLMQGERYSDCEDVGVVITELLLWLVKQAEVNPEIYIDNIVISKAWSRAMWYTAVSSEEVV